MESNPLKQYLPKEHCGCFHALRMFICVRSCIYTKLPSKHFCYWLNNHWLNHALHLQQLDNTGSKLLSGVWLKSWLLFVIQVLWKNVYLKKTVKQRTAALFGPWGYKLWDSLCRKHISGDSRICLWLIWPFMCSRQLPTPFLRICFHMRLLKTGESERIRPPFFPSSFHPLLWLSIPMSGLWGVTHSSLYSGACPPWLLTTCCRQIVPYVPAHYCTFSCFSQHSKCIKAHWNGATNKDSTTADWVDGWATAKEKFDPLCTMFPCVSVCVHAGDSRHRAQRGGINSTLLRVEPGRRVWWNFFPQTTLISLSFKSVCILSDISLCHKGSFEFVRIQGPVLTILKTLSWNNQEYVCPNNIILLR